MFLTVKLYLCLTELFEIELIIYIKMDLALNNLQRLICHKTQQTKQPTNENFMKIPFYFIRRMRFPNNRLSLNSSRPFCNARVDTIFSWQDIAAEVYELDFVLVAC